MTPHLPTSALSLLLFSSILAAESLPPPIDPAIYQEISRYEPIWKISPFVVVTDLSGKADDLAGRYVLTGFARMGDKDVAFIFDRTSLERFTLIPGEPRNGLTLDSVNHQGSLSTLRAKINTAGRTVEIVYDPTASPVAAAPSQPNAPRNRPPTPNPQQPRQPNPNTPAKPQTNPTPRPNPTPIPTPKPNQPNQPNQTTQPPANINQLVGNTPTPSQSPPPPRRVIRRRGIVAPQ